MNFLSEFLLEILFAVVIIIIIIPVIKILNKKAEENMDEDSFSVRGPFLDFLGGILCTLLGGASLVHIIFFANYTIQLWIYVLCSLFLGFGLFLIIYHAIWEVRVDGDQIIYIPLAAKKQVIIFNAITRVKINKDGEIMVYDGDKTLFSVKETCKGYNIFISRLEREKIKFDS
ncbi:MAG: hypothetical protein FWC36_04685 [Spirochaetes bacterium]|nr:hypothetical protein [Spirochaetota bacterium]